MIDDVPRKNHLTAYPGQAPYARGTTPLGYLASPWRIRHRLVCGDGNAESEIFRAAESGRSELEIFPGSSEHTVPILRDVLARALDADVPVILNAGAQTPAFYSAAVSLAEQSGGTFSGGTRYDPLSVFAGHGTIPGGIDTALRLAADCVRFAAETPSRARIIEAGGHVFHDAGATSTQELAYTLASGIEYVRALTSHGLSVDQACASIEFSFSVGTNFAFEVAKLRAARMLWAKIVHHFLPTDPGSKKMRMHARTSRWSQTVYDPHVNILRGTIETLAAVVGGADSISTLPFDDVLDTASELSLRLARNTSLLLSEEAGLAHVVDPAGGSMYFDALTDDVGNAAWTLLQDVEARGGFLRSLVTGDLHTAIRSAAGSRDEMIAVRKEVFVGTNQYPNLGERPSPRERGASPNASPQSELAVPVQEEGVNSVRVMAKAFSEGAALLDVLIPDAGTDSIVAPLQAYRGAEVFERLRAAVDRQARRPKAILATLGPAAWRRARATFASGFLGVAGFDIVDHPGYENIDAAVAAALNEDADIVVACSDDESSPLIAAELVSKLRAQKKDILVLVAGYPKNAVDALKAAGVDDFIHLRANTRTVLETLLTRLGIETSEVAP
ncbi:MAG: acyl-CoA mutase large subunit family protein [Ignavibacteria bacterium]|nr:acyl-CoA mutase large subunit family protein [Ignavibacteria bacterium]